MQNSKYSYVFPIAAAVFLCVCSVVWADPMTVLSIRVNQSSDDARQKSDATVEVDKLDMRLGSRPWNGMRFRNVTIPKGATITKAYVTFRASSSQSASASVNLFAQAADNATAFTTASNNISSRTRTTASVAWTSIPSWTLNTNYNTPDLSALVQEVVDRSGWASGNSLAIITQAVLTGEREAYTWDDVTSYAPLLYVEYTPFARPVAPRLLMVFANSASPTTDELLREEWLKWWGYIVTRISSTDSQATFNAATAVNDVVYISDSVLSGDVNTKLTNTNIGVITDEPALTDELQIATSYSTPSTSNFQIATNSHYITSGFTVGSVSLFSTSQPAISPAGTSAGDMVALGSFFGGGTGLLAVEAGGKLANGSKAAGRRVILPWGSGTNFATLTSNGQLLLRRCLEWAAGIEARWKLDETSGTSAADVGSHAYNGTVTGTATWTAAKLDNGLQLNGSSYVQASGLMGSLKNVTISGWANATNVGTSGGEIISLGDCFAIRVDDGGSNSAIAFFFNGTTWVSISSGIAYKNTGWHHYAAVFDDTNDSLKLYIDGVEKASTTTTSSIGYSGLGANTHIGRHGNGQTAYNLTGTVDDVRVYNYALTAAEVLTLKKASQPTGVRITKWVEKQ